jgi:TonB family protein
MQASTQRRSGGGPEARFAAEGQQPRKLMIALALLLIALVVILVKDRQFWFGAEQATIESDMPESQPAQKAAPASPVQSHPATKKQVPAAKSSIQQEKPAEGAVVTNRTVLPPLDVEVVAGNTHRAIRPKSSVTKVETAPAEIEPPTTAAQREPVATPSIQAETPVSATYPALTQHMNVQGSVVLQAIISTGGVIEDLRVLSGPAILASAAQQAVREWRFKPVIQNGQAVETKARITVNFSIKVADNSASTTLADSRVSDALIITR